MRAVTIGPIDCYHGPVAIMGPVGPVADQIELMDGASSYING